MDFKQYIALDEGTKATKKLNRLSQKALDAIDAAEDALLDWQDSDESGDDSYPHKFVKKYSKSTKDARLYFQFMEEYTRK